MNFLSETFIIFLVVVCILYYCVPIKRRWIVLLLGSYAFYIMSCFTLMIFIMLTTITIYGAARLLEAIDESRRALFDGKDEQWLEEHRAKWRQKFQRQKRWVLTAALLFNFAILFVFKYFQVFTSAINPIFRLLNFSEIGVWSTVILPLGISFYTFQTVGYLADVYWGKVKSEKNIFKFALFTSFFPQLIQGPISRFDQLAPQLFKGNKWNWQNFKKGLMLCAWGAFKMLCISTPCFLIANSIIRGDTGFGGPIILLAYFLWGVYFYTSFSGGIDLARGIAQMLGVHMVENFARPYFATSYSNYWSRWHITLGKWIADYVYYPIALSKWFGRFSRKFAKKVHGAAGKIIPSRMVAFICFLMISLWHGGDPKWFLSGVFVASVVTCEAFFRMGTRKFFERHPKLTTQNLAIRILTIVYTFFMVSISRCILIGKNLGESLSIFKRLFTYGIPDNVTVTNEWEITALAICLFILFVVGILQERGHNIRDFVVKQPSLVQLVYCIIFVLMIIFFASWGEGVVYVYGAV